jgi:hypothetical protein
MVSDEVLGFLRQPNLHELFSIHTDHPQCRVGKAQRAHARKERVTGGIEHKSSKPRGHGLTAFAYPTSPHVE